VRLVFDLPDEDRLPVLGLHFHTFEGGGIPVAKLASHHYAVERSLALLEHHLSSSARLIARSGDLTRVAFISASFGLCSKSMPPPRIRNDTH
jgi:hypothetical protein